MGGGGRRSWSYAGPDTSRKLPRRGTIHQAESSKNSGAHKNATPKAAPLLLPKWTDPADEAQAKMKVSPGWGRRNQRASAGDKSTLKSQLQGAPFTATALSQNPDKKKHLRLPLLFQDQKDREVLELRGLSKAERLVAKESPASHKAHPSESGKSET